MASYTSGYAANIAVRYFLTEIGNRYFQEDCSLNDCFYKKALKCLDNPYQPPKEEKKFKKFDVTNKVGKAIWTYIKEEVFDNECAYCGDTELKLTMEHLEMINKDHGGLHHPGNVVPACNTCNRSRRKECGTYISWQDHLKEIQGQDGNCREAKINRHIENAKYPDRMDRKVIKRLAKSLHDGVTSKSHKTVGDYKTP